MRSHARRSFAPSWWRSRTKARATRLDRRRRCAGTVRFGMDADIEHGVAIARKVRTGTYGSTASPSTSARRSVASKHPGSAANSVRRESPATRSRRASRSWHSRSCRRPHPSCDPPSATCSRATDRSSCPACTTRSAHGSPRAPASTPCSCRATASRRPCSGEPDFGLLTQTDVLDAARRITAGHRRAGDRRHRHRLRQRLQRRAHRAALVQAGAAGCFLEDQVWPKRCGHMDRKRVVPARRVSAEAARRPSAARAATRRST